jgi:hypothetical protein
MNLFIATAVYLGCGAAFLGSIGKKRSRLQWDDPPTRARRLLIVGAWPLILLMTMLGAWEIQQQGDDEWNNFR